MCEVGGEGDTGVTGEGQGCGKLCDEDCLFKGLEEEDDEESVGCLLDWKRLAPVEGVLTVSPEVELPEVLLLGKDKLTETR